MNNPPKREADPTRDTAQLDGTRYAEFQKFWAVMALVLLGVSWKLWAPSADFPQIPLFRQLCHASEWLDWGSLLLMVAGLLIVLLARYVSVSLVSVGLSMFAIAAMVSISLNQHRLQPWAYQFVVCAVLMASCRKSEAVRWMRWIAVSIYFYSALSKFDFQFAHTLGPEFLLTLFGFCGLESSPLSQGSMALGALLFPTFELLLAIGLLFVNTRRGCAVGLIVMHGTLLLILGPFGLQHQPGVLCWNFYLIGQSVFLFLLMGDFGFTGRTEINRLSLPQAFAGGLALFVVLFPLSVFFGVCDHWLAWEVYAPRSSRAKLEISAADVGRLPKSMQAFCQTKDDRSGFHEFDLGRWSLVTVGVPIYPEDRFQFACAADLVQRFDLRYFKISAGAESNRWTGEREWEMVNRVDELNRLSRRFRLNTQPRGF